MPIPASPVAKVQVGELFEQQLQALKSYSGGDAGGELREGDWPFFLPEAAEGWDGNLFAIEQMGAPFSRSEQEDQFAGAVRDPDNSGTTGDLVMIQLQGDFLAMLERTFRARNQTSVRARMHAAARRSGHSHPHGVLEIALLDYIKRIATQSHRGQE